MARGATRQGNGRTGRRLGSVVLATLAVVFLGYLAYTALIGALPSLNPFGTETTVRSGPAVLQSIEPLSEYRAATGNYELIIEMQEDSQLLPSFLRGERTLFVASGSVDAGVEFSGLDEDAITVSDDGRSVTVDLPAPRLFEARVDPDRSRVFDRDRGVFDRLEGLFEDSPTEDRPLFALSERRLREAATEDRELLATAARNTRSMLEGMLRGLGFENVTVNFAEEA